MQFQLKFVILFSDPSSVTCQVMFEKGTFSLPHSYIFKYPQPEVAVDMCSFWKNESLNVFSRIQVFFLGQSS
jgi:hypothetical protein